MTFKKMLCTVNRDRFLGRSCQKVAMLLLLRTKCSASGVVKVPLESVLVVVPPIFCEVLVNDVETFGHIPPRFTKQ